MNRHDEIDHIMRLVHDKADDPTLRAAIGWVIDAAYKEGYRQRIEDQIESDLGNLR